ncbi:unnamed protein product [Sympodiomycopsis kandeliae]
MADGSPQRDVFSSLVLLAASGFFLASGWQLASGMINSKSRQSKSKRNDKHPNTSVDKPWHHSNVQVTYQTDSTMCDYPFAANQAAAATQGSGIARPVIRAGALLKLIDIVAGVAARRHAGGSCVTISLDSVLFLSPIHLGDLIHLSAAVNRSFTSSMEVGVRIMKEDPTDSGKTFYVSHAYLTFVLKKTSQSSASSTTSMPNLSPQTPLQWRRHFLAGQRRAKRLIAARRGQDEDGVDVTVKDQVRENVMDLSAPKNVNVRIDEKGSVAGSQAIETIEVELLAQALYSRTDQGVIANVTQDGRFVEAYLSGDQDGQKIRHSVDSVRCAAERLGLTGDPTAEEPSAIASHKRRPSTSTGQRQRRMSSLPHAHLAASGAEIRSQDTCVQTLHIVFPEHANSVSILFGGQTMSWMEEAALMCARHLPIAGSSDAGPLRHSWRTVAMDGLEFRRPVHIGEVMTFTAICLHTFTNSAEIYVAASAETHWNADADNRSQDANSFSRRFTNDALFTLAFIPDKQVDTTHSSQTSSLLRNILIDEDTPLYTLAMKAPQRKQRRLELRDMLSRIYASN